MIPFIPRWSICVEGPNLSKFLLWSPGTLESSGIGTLREVHNPLFREAIRILHDAAGLWSWTLQNFHQVGSWYCRSLSCFPYVFAGWNFLGVGGWLAVSFPKFSFAWSGGGIFKVIWALTCIHQKDRPCMAITISSCFHKLWKKHGSVLGSTGEKANRL